MYEISILSSKHSESFNKGKIQETFQCETLQELASLTTEYHWAPALFEDHKRTITNCKGTQIIALDIDENLTIDTALDRLDSSGLNYAVVTSRSHQKPKGDNPPCDRFRIILPLERVITSDIEFKRLFFHIQSNMFPEADNACKDISRFFFAGREVVAFDESGELLGTVVPKGEESSDSENLQDTASNTVSALSRKTLDFLVNFAPSGERHNRHVQALFDMKQQGYSKEDAIRKSKYVFEMHNCPWGAKEQKRVDDIYDNRQVKQAKRFPALKKGKDERFYPDKTAAKNYYFLIRELGYSPAFNVLDEQIYTGDPDGAIDRAVPFRDTDIAHIAVKARQEGLLASKDVLMDYVTEMAWENRYHPLKDPIDSEYAKGADNYQGAIDELISTINFSYDAIEEQGFSNKEEARAAFESYIRKWIVGCVAKLYRPGAQNLVLVFEGPQGVGKSRWLSRLSPWRRGFVEDMVNPNSKDHELRHLTTFIWHVAEMDAVTGRREASELKSFFTREYTAARGAYQRTVKQGYSICNFCGSVNTDDFLTDGSGNRRYLVIPVKYLNSEHDINTARVFAEGRALLENGFQYWLSMEEIHELETRLEPYKARDMVADIAPQIQPGNDFYSTKELFERFDVTPKLTDYRKLSAELRRRGIRKVRRRMPDGAYRQGYLVSIQTPGSLSVVKRDQGPD